MKLVIVESPTKAKTIRHFLPREYKVIASMGHVRDLPQSAKEIPENLKKLAWAKLGVDVDNDFAPLYIVPQTKRKIVKELRDELAKADELILATDEDREGESISWHLLSLLDPKVPTKRMVFHEITKEAISEALSHCRSVDEKLVRAQETRRILDRLVGYTLSPLLWKKIAFGLSAGRVQSVAVTLIVQRERERRAFRQGTYWDLEATLNHADKDFSAILFSLDGKRLATGKDFDEHTGKVDPKANVILLGEAAAESFKQKLLTTPFVVQSIEEKPVTRRPYPPFITSTLQQEANRKLGLTAKNTMRIAQGLYENGLITYMRTDSVNLSGQAISAARHCVMELYGKDYLSPSPRQFSTKSKGAQEAHEAIRPAGSVFKHPKDTGLAGKELAVYDLIWKRTVATQMVEARQTFITVEITAADALFKASGKRLDFAGFFRAYVEGSDDPDAALDSRETLLPHLKVGDQTKCQKIAALKHETQPPARYTEASLVKKLEAEGIGRPSTYASIISTIVDRGYVIEKGSTLIPTYTAFAVSGLLERHFPHLVDVGFTAKMENTLDDISTGDVAWLPYLKTFYHGRDGLDGQVKQHQDEIDPEEARTLKFDDLEANVKIGRYGAYLELTKGVEMLKATIPESVAPADLSGEAVEQILKNKQDGPQTVGRHPETNDPIFVLDGRFGPYVQMGDIAGDKVKLKRVSLPKGMKPADVTFDIALGLLSLPRHVGNHPETGGKITANAGRFGPFVCLDNGKEGKDYRSLKISEGDDPVTVTLERAVALLAQPKKGKGRAKAVPLKDLGPHPDDGEIVQIFNGPYGHYVKHKKTNASIPKDRNFEEVTLAEVIPWLKAKAGTKGKKKR